MVYFYTIYCINNIYLLDQADLFVYGLRLWCLTPLSTLFQLYRGGYLYTVQKDYTNFPLYEIQTQEMSF